MKRRYNRDFMHSKKVSDILCILLVVALTAVILWNYPEMGQ